MNVALFIPLIALPVALILAIKSRLVEVFFAIMLCSGALMLLANQMGRIIAWIEGRLRVPKESSSTSPSPSATPSATATPTPVSEPPPHDAPPPPWEWIGFTVLSLVAAAVASLLIVFLIKALRRAAAKRRTAKRKAIEREKLHERHRAEWSDLLVKEKTLGSRWLKYEDSPKLSLKYPIMRQLNDPKIAPVIEAMGRVKAYRADEPTDLDENPVETEYAKAVSQFEIALDEAERYAKKVRWNNFSPSERKKAQLALDILDLAMDTANYPDERKRSYERVAKIMEDLMIPVTTRAMLAIEDSVGRLELTV